MDMCLFALHVTNIKLEAKAKRTDESGLLNIMYTHYSKKLGIQILIVLKKIN